MGWEGIHGWALNVALGVLISVVGAIVYAAFQRRRSRRVIVIGSLLVALGLAAPWIAGGAEQLLKSDDPKLSATVDGSRVELGVPNDDRGYQETVYLRPSDAIDVVLRVENLSDRVVHRVTVFVSLSDGLLYVPNSAKFANSFNAFGTPLADDPDEKFGNSLFGSGWDLGDYGPTGTLYVKFRATVRPDVPTGTTFMATNIGIDVEDRRYVSLVGPEIVISN